MFRIVNWVVERFIFRPTFKGINRYDKLLLPNEMVIKSTDDVSLRALHIQQNKNSKKCVIYSHGNMGHIYRSNKKMFEITKMLPNVNFIMYDYRGYGKSTGSPTEDGMYDDIYSVWLHTVNNLGYDPKDITLYGYSLGCVPTLWLGKKIDISEQIIIHAGFSSLSDFLYVPFFDHKFNNRKNIKEIGDKIPITVLHSIDDDLIPVRAVKNFKENNAYVSLFFTFGNHRSPIYTPSNIKTIKALFKE